MSDEQIRKTEREPDRGAPVVAFDAFTMATLRHAREYGIREERERVIAWLREPVANPEAREACARFADFLERGEHDGGRRFPPLPPEDETPAKKEPT